MRWPSDVTLFFRENGIALEKAQRQHREGHGRSLNPTPVGSATRNRVPQSGSAINSNQTGYPSPNPSCSDHCTFKCPRIKFKRFQRILQLTIHLIRVDSSPCFAMLRHASPCFAIPRHSSAGNRRITVLGSSNRISVISHATPVQPITLTVLLLP